MKNIKFMIKPVIIGDYRIVKKRFKEILEATPG
jgi:hypothetical protein